MKLFTSSQVAELTGRQRITVLNLRRRHGLAQKVGRDWVFTQEDVDFINSVHPLGGRPAKAGPNTYKADPAQVKKGRPKKTESPA